MSKVLLVGGAGYVGSVLAAELLAKGYSIRILDRMFYGREAIADFVDRAELITADMRDIDPRHFEGCDAVINLGGLSNDPTAEFDPRANAELNTYSSIGVAEMAKRAGVPRFIYASTCSIYDRGIGEDAQDILQDETSEVAPRAAYATSKYAAEQPIIGMADDTFCPVALRKGTVFGFSPRMRYDLVVNTFVKDALSRGRISLHYGGAMWRPLLEVHDAARAYVAALQANEAQVRGEVFNISSGNFRISELALRVQQALGTVGVAVDLEVDFSYRMIRSYRVSSEKARRILGFEPRVSVEESVVNMVEEIRRRGLTDFSNPRYYNIEWMKLLEEAVGIVHDYGYVLSRPVVAESVERALEPVSA